MPHRKTPSRKQPLPSRKGVFLYSCEMIHRRCRIIIDLIRLFQNGFSICDLNDIYRAVCRNPPMPVIRLILVHVPQNRPHRAAMGRDQNRLVPICFVSNQLLPELLRPLTQRCNRLPVLCRYKMQRIGIKFPELLDRNRNLIIFPAASKPFPASKAKLRNCLLYTSRCV